MLQSHSHLSSRYPNLNERDAAVFEESLLESMDPNEWYQLSDERKAEILDYIHVNHASNVEPHLGHSSNAPLDEIYGLSYDAYRESVGDEHRAEAEAALSRINQTYLDKFGADFERALPGAFYGQVLTRGLKSGHKALKTWLTTPAPDLGRYQPVPQQPQAPQQQNVWDWLDGYVNNQPAAHGLWNVDQRLIAQRARDMSARELSAYITAAAESGEILFNIGKFIASQGASIGLSAGVQAMFGADNAAYIGMSVAALAGSPVDFVITAGAYLFAKVQAQQDRIQSNQTPGRAQLAQRLAMVRVGTKWFPAVVSSELKSEELFSQSDELTFVYGDELVWRLDADGNPVPDFKNRLGQRRVQVNDDDLAQDGRILGEEALLRGQNGWFLLSNEYERKVLQNQKNMMIQAQNGAEIENSMFGIQDYMPDVWFEHYDLDREQVKRGNWDPAIWLRDGFSYNWNVQAAIDLLNEFEQSERGVMASEFSPAKEGFVKKGSVDWMLDAEQFASWVQTSALPVDHITYRQQYGYADWDWFWDTYMNNLWKSTSDAYSVLNAKDKNKNYGFGDLKPANSAEGLASQLEDISKQGLSEPEMNYMMRKTTLRFLMNYLVHNDPNYNYNPSVAVNDVGFDKTPDFKNKAQVWLADKQQEANSAAIFANPNEKIDNNNAYLPEWFPTDALEDEYFQLGQGMNFATPEQHQLVEPDKGKYGTDQFEDIKPGSYVYVDGKYREFKGTTANGQAFFSDGHVVSNNNHLYRWFSEPPARTPHKIKYSSEWSSYLVPDPHGRVKRFNKQLTQQEHAQYLYNLLQDEKRARRQAYKQSFRQGLQFQPLDDITNKDGDVIKEGTYIFINGRPAQVVHVSAANERENQHGQIQYKLFDTPNHLYTITDQNAKDLKLMSNEQIQRYLGIPRKQPIKVNDSPENALKTDFLQGDVQNPAQVVDDWINNRYEWQTSTKVPEWMVPNIDDSAYALQFQALVKKYENDYMKSRDLERVRAAVSRNSVISYMNSEHGEVHTVWKLNGDYKDPYRLSRISQDRVPWLAYTADGHPVLKNDAGIDHGADIHMNMVRAPNGNMHYQQDLDHLPKLSEFNQISQGHVSQDNEASIMQSNQEQA